MTWIETLNDSAQIWLNTMWTHSIDATFVFLIVGGVWMVIRHKVCAQFGYCLFLLVLLKLSIPNGLSLPSMLNVLFPETVNQMNVLHGNFGPIKGMGTGSVEESTPSLSKTASSPVETQANKTATAISLPARLMMIWAGISSLLFLRLFLYQYQTRQKVKNTQPVNPNNMSIHISRIEETAQIKGRRMLRQTGIGGVPVEIANEFDIHDNPLPGRSLLRP